MSLLTPVGKTFRRAFRRLFSQAPSSISPDQERSWMERQFAYYSVGQPWAGPLSIVNGNLTGETWEMRQAYREWAFREPAAKAALQTKCFAVAQLDLQVHPDDPSSAEDKRAAEWVKHSIMSAPGGSAALVANILLPGLIDGFSVNEKLYGKCSPRDNRYPNWWTFKGTAQIDTQHVRFRLDPYRQVVGIQATQGVQTATWNLPPEDYLIYTHLKLFENPFGFSDLRAAVRACRLIESAIRLRHILLTNYSGPFLKARAGDPAARSALMGIMEDVKANGWVVVPDGTEIEVMSLTVANLETFNKAIEDYRQEIVQAIQGAYLQLLEGGIQDGRGNTQVHKSISEIFQWWLAVTVGETINAGLVPDLVIPNFGHSVGFPRVELGGIDEASMASALQRFKAGQDLGLELSKAQVRQVGGFEMPTGDDDVLPPPSDGPKGPDDQGGGDGGPGGGGDNPFAGMFSDHSPGNSLDFPPKRPRGHFGDVSQFSATGDPFVLYDADTDTFAEWHPYTNKQTGKSGWISSGGLVRYQDPRSGPTGAAEGQKTQASRAEAAQAVAKAIQAPERVQEEHLPALMEHMKTLDKPTLQGIVKSLSAKVGGTKAQLADRVVASIRAGQAGQDREGDALRKMPEPGAGKKASPEEQTLRGMLDAGEFDNGKIAKQLQTILDRDGADAVREVAERMGVKGVRTKPVKEAVHGIKDLLADNEARSKGLEPAVVPTKPGQAGQDRQGDALRKMPEKPAETPAPPAGEKWADKERSPENDAAASKEFKAAQKRGEKLDAAGAPVLKQLSRETAGGGKPDPKTKAKYDDIVRQHQENERLKRDLKEYAGKPAPPAETPAPPAAAPNAHVGISGESPGVPLTSPAPAANLPGTPTQGDKAVKEPYQMTRDEYRQHVTDTDPKVQAWKGHLKVQKGKDKRETQALIDNRVSMLVNGHSSHVMAAMGNNIPVPPEVLAEYPHLTNPPAPKAKARGKKAEAAPEPTPAAGHDPLGGMGRAAQVDALKHAVNRGEAGDPDPLGYAAAGPPANHATAAPAIRDAVDRLSGGVGVTLDQLYKEVGPKTGQSKSEFVRSLTAMDDAGQLRLGGHPTSLDELPDPQVAPVVSGKVMGYVGPGTKDVPPAPAAPTPAPAPAAKPAPKAAPRTPHGEAVMNAHENATGKAKELLANAIHNAGGDPDTGKAPKGTPAYLAKNLAASWVGGQRSGASAADLKPLEDALTAVGAKPVGAAGQTLPFDGARHDSPEGVSTGHPVTVARQGWTIPDGKGGELLLTPAKVSRNAPAAPPAAPKPPHEMTHAEYFRGETQKATADLNAAREKLAKVSPGEARKSADQHRKELAMSSSHRPEVKRAISDLVNADAAFKDSQYYGNRPGSSREHRAAVEAALVAGKTVPPEVLADYPDLRTKPPAAPKPDTALTGGPIAQLPPGPTQGLTDPAEVEAAARKSSYPWEVSGADRIRTLRKGAGRVSPEDLANIVTTYGMPHHSPGSVKDTVHSLARGILSSWTPEKRQAAERNYAALNEHAIKAHSFPPTLAAALGSGQTAPAPKPAASAPATPAGRPPAAPGYGPHYADDATGNYLDYKPGVGFSTPLRSVEERKAIVAKLAPAIEKTWNGILSGMAQQRGYVDVGLAVSLIRDASPPGTTTNDVQNALYHLTKTDPKISGHLYNETHHMDTPAKRANTAIWVPHVSGKGDAAIALLGNQQGKQTIDLSAYKAVAPAPTPAAAAGSVSDRVKAAAAKSAADPHSLTDANVKSLMDDVKTLPPAQQHKLAEELTGAKGRSALDSQIRIRAHIDGIRQVLNSQNV